MSLSLSSISFIELTTLEARVKRNAMAIAEIFIFSLLLFFAFNLDSVYFMTGSDSRGGWVLYFVWLSFSFWICFSVFWCRGYNNWGLKSSSMDKTSFPEKCWRSDGPSRAISGAWTAMYYSLTQAHLYVSLLVLLHLSCQKSSKRVRFFNFGNLFQWRQQKSQVSSTTSSKWQVRKWWWSASQDFHGSARRHHQDCNPILLLGSWFDTCE